MQTIIFTGGGSGGHVIPAITLIQALQHRHADIEIKYIGSKQGVERKLIESLAIPYQAISTGKLRRYLSLKNLSDIFRIITGISQAFFYLRKFDVNTTTIFSTGGFVVVPVVIAAKLLGIRILIHEQTTRIGLANRICSRFAAKILISFEGSRPFFPAAKTSYSGYPVRPGCYQQEIRPIQIGSVQLDQTGKKILFISGGGNGSKLINDFFKPAIEALSQQYTIVHQVGDAFIEEYQPMASQDYIPIAFIGEEMIDLLKLATIIISRSGAGMVSELLAMEKASILIPLKIAQQNEQFHNATEAQTLLGSMVVEEDQLNQFTPQSLIDVFMKKRRHDQTRVKTSSTQDESQSRHSTQNATDRILAELISAY